MATQATLINPQGKKVVVESGSQQAQQFFGQGYKLMTAANTPAPSAPPGVTIPKGMSVIATPADIPKYNVGGQFGQTGQPGSGLYGTLKPTAAPTVTPGTTSPVVTPTAPSNADANAYINSGQQNDFNEASKNDEPGVRSSVSNYKTIFDDLSTSLKSNLPEKPATLSMAEQYKQLRTQYGVADLEGSLATLQSQARDIQALSRQRTAAELAKPVAMNVIAGRVSEEERQDNERLQAVNSSIQTITQQLQTTYGVIDNMMKYSGQDYDNATKAYDTQLSQNLQIMGVVKSIADKQDDQKEAQADNARANLQIIYKNLQDNKVDTTKLSDAEKANISKLELQSGLPQGFFQNVVDKNPKAEILSTTTREDRDKKYVDIIMRNPDGSLKVTTQYLGTSRGSAPSGSGGTKVTEADKKRAAVSSMSKDLSSLTGSDGYVSPTDYKKGRQLWTQAGGTAKEYDESFGTTYVNPTQYREVGLSSAAKAYNDSNPDPYAGY